MTPTNRIDAVSIGQLCLQQIDSLRGELEAAIGAIARNSLPDFERSLWQQEMLSTSLQRSLAALDTLTIDPTLRTRVQAAGARLQRTGHSYQQLVAQSSRCAAVLQDLGNLYQHEPATAVHTCPNTLSCEA